VAQQCYLSEVRFGQDSPYVLIFALRAQKPTNETIESLRTMAGQFATLLQPPTEFTPLWPTYQITGLVHYLFVNRTTGEYRESGRSAPADAEAQDQQRLLFEKIRRRMIGLATQALQAGYMSMIRNEMIFQYTFELKFINSKGQIVSAGDKPKKTRFDEGGLTYSKIVADLFGADADVTCCELMAVYLGVVGTKDVVDANRHLIDVLTKPMFQ
jgi:hypothetical protein